MASLYKRVFLICFFIGCYFLGYEQILPGSIIGKTSRILPDAVKSMSQIVAEDRPALLSPFEKIILRPDPEGPHPITNSQAIPENAPVERTALTKNQFQPELIHSNFLAIWGSYHTGYARRESAYTPPDNCGDVGTQQVVVTANTRLKVFSKPDITGPGLLTPAGVSTQTAPAIFNVDLNSFFNNNTRGIHNISDAHVRFDRLSRRWFVVAIEVDHDVNNYCCIAVSSSDVITNSTSFSFYYFNISSTGGNANDFFDYPTLGIDKFALNIGGNMFTNGVSFAGCNMWVINKDSLNAGVLKVTLFGHDQTHTDMYTPQGVHNDNPLDSTGYFIGTSSTVYSKLVIRKINHSTPVPTISPDIPLNTISTYGPNVVKIPQGDSIDGNDHRLCAAMIMKNKITGNESLWTAQGSLSNSVGVASASGDRDGIVWYEISNLKTVPVIVQTARLFDANTPFASSVNYIYPTIATNGQGHSLMGFSSAGPSKYPEASIAVRYSTDPAGTFQSVTDLTNAMQPYNPGASRWGDFTQTVVDPLDNMTMWTFTQYADTLNSWGVRAAQIAAPPPPNIKLEVIPVCNTSTITISGIPVNNAAFFDTGSDSTGPGFNRLKITVSGPSAIAVSNITFITTDTISASFNLPDGTLQGTYTVTVTNPDGQSSNTSFVLANTCSPVKITIVDFSGNKVSEGVQLNWITQNEQNIKNFIVEKSPDSIHFENFIALDSKGMSSSNNNYSAIDNHPFPNFSYYRLKIYNQTGNFLYSRIIKVATNPGSVALTRIYPNPAVSTLNLEFFSTSSQSINVVVFDYSGRRMMSQVYQLNTGINTQSLNVAALARGGYIIELLDSNNQSIDKTKIIRQ